MTYSYKIISYDIRTHTYIVEYSDGKRTFRQNNTLWNPSDTRDVIDSNIKKLTPISWFKLQDDIENSSMESIKDMFQQEVQYEYEELAHIPTNEDIDKLIEDLTNK